MTTKQYTIPNTSITNKPDSFRLVSFKIPDDDSWCFYYKNLLYQSTRGRNWDGKTGNIRDAQSLAWVAFDSYECTDMRALDDIAKEIEKLKELLMKIKISSSGNCCCCCNSEIEILTDDETGFTDPTTGGGQDENSTEFKSYKCSWAHAFVNELINSVQLVKEVKDVGEGNTLSLTVATEVYLSVATIYDLLWSVWYSFVSFVIDKLTPQLSDSAVNFLTVNKSDLINAIVCSDGQQAASDNWYAIINKAPSLVVRTYLKIWSSMTDFSPPYLPDNDKPVLDAKYQDAVCDCLDDPITFDCEGYNFIVPQQIAIYDTFNLPFTMTLTGDDAVSLSTTSSPNQHFGTILFNGADTVPQPAGLYFEFDNDFSIEIGQVTGVNEPLSTFGANGQGTAFIVLDTHQSALSQCLAIDKVVSLSSNLKLTSLKLQNIFGIGAPNQTYNITNIRLVYPV